MYWINIGAFIIGGLNIGLAVLVWLRNPNHRINQTFALAALSVGLWAGTEAFFRGRDGYQRSDGGALPLDSSRKKRIL